MPAKARKTPRKPARKAPSKRAAPRATKRTRAAKPGSKADDAAVRACIAAVRPEHRATVERIDRILREEIPDVVATAKYRKPSNPLGVPFYGRPGHGWIAAVWSFKDKVGVGFFAGAELDPPPAFSIGPRMRRHDVRTGEELDERRIRAWTRQAAAMQGWAKV